MINHPLSLDAILASAVGLLVVLLFVAIFAVVALVPDQKTTQDLDP